MYKKDCNEITTEMSDEEIIAFLLKNDRTFAPQGSGGYAIKHEDTFEEFKIVTFEQLDCRSATKHTIFIKNGKIYLQNIVAYIMNVLSESGNSFSFKKVPVPDSIQKYVSKKELI
jgi:hypothetical protein